MEKEYMEKKHVSTEEIGDFVKIMDKEVPLNELRANLKEVAKKRGLVGATLEMHFADDKPLYYNVYRYAFFGMVPDIELDPRAKWIDPVPEKKQIFTRKQ
jgi:hypothetical protein